MFRDWVDVDDAGFYRSHAAEYVPVRLKAPERVDASAALAEEPSKEATQILHAKLF